MKAKLAFALYIFLAIARLAVAQDINFRCLQEPENRKQDANEVVSIAAGKLCEKWQMLFEKISWQAISIDQRGYFANKHTAFTFEMSELKNGRMWVKIYDATAKKRQLATIWFRVKGYKTAWTVKRDISINSILQKEDVNQSLVDITSPNFTPDQLIKDPIGYFVKKGLRRGNLITDANVSEPPLIIKNEKIQIVLQNNELKIIARGVALSHGWQVGEKIIVIVNGASEKVEATVLKKGWVNVSI